MKWMVSLLLLSVVFLAAAAPAAERKPVRITPVDVEQALDLKAREEAVAAREKELAAREKELAAVQKDVDEKLRRIAALQKEIREELAGFSAVRSREFKNLIKVYSSMSASKVAPLLNKMDDKDVVRILRAMKSDLVAKILPKLEPDKAVEVSRRLGLIPVESSD